MAKLLVGNGHGIETLGKRSPDGKFREYKYCRDVAKEVVKRLEFEGYDAELLVPEENDISLAERVRRVNAWCNKLGTKNVCYVSIHNNAAGNGSQWMSATGWEAYSSRGQTQGDKLADCLYESAEEVLKGLGLDNLKIRKDMSDGDPDKESDFYVLKNTKCAAALTENFFMDNKTDVAWLESRAGFDAIVEIHVRGIIQYVNKYMK